MRRFLRHPVTIIIGGFILLVFLIRSGAFIPIERGVLFIFVPIQRRLYAFTVALRTSPLFSWKHARETQQKYEQLHKDYDALTADIVRLRLAGDENKTLRQLLKFREETGHILVTAHVLLRKIEPGTFVLFIDRGARDGLRPGMPVVTGQGILIGKILVAHDTVAEVAVLPDPRFRVAATLAQSSDTAGYVRGEGGISVLMELIPATRTVQQREIIVTSGLEAGIPRGLRIGTIERVLGGTDRLFQRAALQPVQSLAVITDVAILFPPR